MIELDMFKIKAELEALREVEKAVRNFEKLDKSSCAIYPELYSNYKQAMYTAIKKLDEVRKANERV